MKENAVSEHTGQDEYSFLYSTATKTEVEIINELSLEESAKLVYNTISHPMNQDIVLCTLQLCPFAAMGTCEFERCVCV